jgi:hypothetical protein
MDRKVWFLRVVFGSLDFNASFVTIAVKDSPASLGVKGFSYLVLFGSSLLNWRFSMPQIKFKQTAVAVAISFSMIGAPALAQQAPAGASKASSSAVGGVSAGTIGAAVAVVAAAAALSGGSGGSASTDATSSATTAATQASTAASQARTANTAAAAAATTLSALAGYGTLATSASGATLLSEALDLQLRAEAAASNLALANTVSVSGVVNPITGTIICAAANTCTAAEKLLLAYEAARLSKAAVEASLVYIAAVEAAALLITDKTVTAYATGTAALASAYSAALLAQTAANATITAYNALASALGISGTSITASSGTTGSIGASGSVSYTAGSE